MDIRHIEILDTTLRDGAQANAVNYSLSDKRQILELLTELGIELVEGGMPSSNPLDSEFFESAESPALAVFEKTVINGDYSAITNANKLKTRNVVIYGKANISGVTRVLDMKPSEYLDSIRLTLSMLNKKRVIFDAEHFFDAYQENKKFAMDVLKAAIDGGADTLVLCDTDGGSLPLTIYTTVKNVVHTFGKSARIGIHAHNDSGLAVSNSLVAVDAGATHVQGTLLGFGERVGNACLSTVMPNLEFKCGLDVIGGERMRLLTETCRKVAEIANINPDPTLPYVGRNAFLHKAGTHMNATLKDRDSYQHIDPALVGNESGLSVSLLSGKANILAKTADFVNINEDEAKILLESIKKKEAEGYTFEGADASFKMFVKKTLGLGKEYFDLLTYRGVTDETGGNSAIIKIRAGGEETLAGGEGVGPIHTLDNALRTALSSAYPEIEKVRLIDYKVRVINSGKAAASNVRVLITSSDGEMTWSNVGLSPDIIEASYIALAESFNYYLSEIRD